MAFPRLRYSKTALLLFGAGLVVGLAVVSVPLPRLARVASIAMALGIAALPATLMVDWRRRTSGATPAPKRRRTAKRGGQKASKPGKRKASPPRPHTRQQR
jgi:hypothetical protein